MKSFRTITDCIQKETRKVERLNRFNNIQYTTGLTFLLEILFMSYIIKF